MVDVSTVWTGPAFKYLWSTTVAFGAALDLDRSFDEFVARRSAGRWPAARAAPDGYAYRVLLNLLHDRHRASLRRVMEQPLDDRTGIVGVVGDHADFVGERDAIVRAVRLLPGRQREVVVLRFFADLSVSETAAAIGASQGSVKTHTSRALARLREVLA